MARKTVNVEAVKDVANAYLANDAVFLDSSFRNGVIAVVESMLHHTGNYRGFKYLPSEWDEERDALRIGFDDTRRMYY